MHCLILKETSDVADWFIDNSRIQFEKDILRRFDGTERNLPTLFSLEIEESSDVADRFIDNSHVQFEKDILESFDGTERNLQPLFSSKIEEYSFDGYKECDDADDDGDYPDNKIEDAWFSTDLKKKDYHNARIPCISNTALKTCETVLVGFEMACSENILIHGDFNIDCFQPTENSERIQSDLEENKALWEHESTSDAIRMSQVNALLNAIKDKDYTELLKLYYRDQHYHTLSDQDIPMEVPVFVHRSVLASTWIPHVEKALKAINEVTPGINLYETDIIDKSKIEIGVDRNSKTGEACTWYGSIFSNHRKDKKPFIHLGKDWEKENMGGTSIHELMHALSFHHEMQRRDRHLYVDVSKATDSNYRTTIDKPLTRFDPFSVMMYHESSVMKRKEGDPIWKLKTSSRRCQTLSELNKVALNLIFKPCINESKNFKPKLSTHTAMLYCGRQVMSTHNQVGESTTDGSCGPNNWANCPACRVIKQIKQSETKTLEIPTLKKCLENGKWQGLSGLFYCGKKYQNTHFEEICGPDNGKPCNDCGMELYQGYSIAAFQTAS